MPYQLIQSLIDVVIPLQLYRALTLTIATTFLNIKDAEMTYIRALTDILDRKHCKHFVDTQQHEFATLSLLLSKVVLAKDCEVSVDENRHLQITNSVHCSKSSNHVLIPTKRRRYSVDCSAYGWTADTKQMCGELSTNPNLNTKEQAVETRRHFDRSVYPILSKAHNPVDVNPNSNFTSKNMCLESANASLHEPSLFTITQTGFGGWFQDEIIDMSFDFLERILDCQKHRIALSNVSWACEMFKTGEHAVGCSNLGLEKYYELPHWDMEAVAKLTDKDFLVFPVSDGYPANLHHGWPAKAAAFRHIEDTGQRGRHWSVLLIDCRTRNMQAHSLDSLDNKPGMHREYFDTVTQRFRDMRSDNYKVAECITKGLEVLLNSHIPGVCKKIDLTFDTCTPHQSHQNTSRHCNSGGACGPFVYLAVKEIVQYIVECYADNKSEAIGNLKLPANFAAELQWNSQYTRQSIRILVNRELRTREWLNNGMSKWLDERPQPGYPTGWQTWLRSKGLPLSFFWDPYAGISV